MNKFRRAVVLFNLGGPDSTAAIRPFLYNLFSDRAILSLPRLPRTALACIISQLRAGKAREIYDRMGGKSPILEKTREQSAALEQRLQEEDQEVETRTFIAMRYWHPRAREVVGRVKAWQPDEVILLPLYPQYSTTTTQSSILEWMAEAQQQGLLARHRAVCCYPDEDGFLRAHAESIKDCLIRLRAEGIDPGRMALLFSAHGLPQRVIRRGDPYQLQVETTCAGVMKTLHLPSGWPPLDWRICYQSRVGPMKWIGPSIDDVLVQLGSEGKGVIVVPIAFVSEHAETLVELDEEYRTFAMEKGVTFYRRINALGKNPDFIDVLARLVKQACGQEVPVCARERDDSPGHLVCELLS